MLLFQQEPLQQQELFCNNRSSCAPVSNRILKTNLLLFLQDILPDYDTTALAESRSGRSLRSGQPNEPVSTETCSFHRLNEQVSALTGSFG